MFRRTMAVLIFLLGSFVPLHQVSATANPEVTGSPGIRVWQLTFTVSGTRIQTNGALRFSGPPPASLTIPLPSGYRDLLFSGLPAGSIRIGVKAAVIQAPGETVSYSLTLPKKGRYLLWPMTLGEPVTTLAVFTGPHITFPIILNQEFWDQGASSYNGVTYQAAATRPLPAGQSLHLLFELPPVSPSPPGAVGNTTALTATGVTLAGVLLAGVLWQAGRRRQSAKQNRR